MSSFETQSALNDDFIYFRLEKYSQDSLKKYFDQEGLALPIDQIERNVAMRDYAFFL